MAHRRLALFLALGLSLIGSVAAAGSRPTSEVESLEKQIKKSGVLHVLGEYGPVAPDHARYLLIVDRPAGEPDLATTADGKVWIVEGRGVRPATERDISGELSQEAIRRGLATIEKYSVALVLPQPRRVVRK